MIDKSDAQHVLDDKITARDGETSTSNSNLNLDGIPKEICGTIVDADSAAERRLTTKLDLRLTPILGLLYLICFLDRTNIANARLAGLEKSLHMPSNGFNTCLWIFYVPFVLFEIPSNMFLSLPWVRPNLFLGAQCFVLGVCAMCQGLTHSYEGLLACRFLMGVVETGLPAGAGLLIASYYRKRELSLRFALFFACGIGGSCFSGLLAYAIMDMAGTAELEGWRWIFILEGLITIAFSILVFVFVPHFPAQQTFLDEYERTMMLARLVADKGVERTDLDQEHWTKLLFSYKIWLLTLLFFLADMSAGSLSSFNPTILSQLGWTARRAQVMTIPIWITGIVSGLSLSLLSGRLNKRWPFLLPCILISACGWAIQLAQVQPAAVRYFAQFLISFGTFAQMPIYIGMLTANLRGRAFQSVGTGIQLGFGNCANFVSSNVFISAQSPRYPVGFGTGLALTSLAFPVMLCWMTICVVHNRRMKQKKVFAQRDGRELDDQVDYLYVF